MEPQVEPMSKEQRRKELRSARNRAYYERNRELIRAKRREEYDTDKRKEYYYENHDKVLESQRKHYQNKLNQQKVERLNALLEIVKEDALRKLITMYIEDPNIVSLADVSTLEKSTILLVNKSD
jgi:hypothetical protein